MSNFGEGMGGTIGLLALVVGCGLLLFYLTKKGDDEDTGASIGVIEDAIEEMQGPLKRAAAEVDPEPEELDDIVEEHYY